VITAAKPELEDNRSRTTTRMKREAVS